MVRFYMKLIPNCNEMAHPLHQLLKGSSDTRRRPTHTRAVHDLKESLVDATNLHIFDPGKPLAIEMGGSWSRKRGREMNQRDQFLPAHESELLALV